MSDSRSLSEVGAPAQTIHLYELWTTASYQQGYSYYRWYADNLINLPVYPRAISFTWCSSAPSAARMSIGGYQNTSNWGFADGHVKALKQGQIMDKMWCRAASTDPLNACYQAVPNPTQAIAENRLNLVHYNEAFK